MKSIKMLMMIALTILSIAFFAQDTTHKKQKSKKLKKPNLCLSDPSRCNNGKVQEMPKMWSRLKSFS